MLARHCAWCGQWPTEADRRAHENGAEVTHGMCGTCRLRQELEMAREDARTAKDAFTRSCRRNPLSDATEAAEALYLSLIQEVWKLERRLRDTAA